MSAVQNIILFSSYFVPAEIKNGLCDHQQLCFSINTALTLYSMLMLSVCMRLLALARSMHAHCNKHSVVSLFHDGK